MIGKRAIRMVTATHVLELPSHHISSPRINNLNVNALSKSLMANVMDYHLIGDMGLRYGVAEVMRWKPAFVAPQVSIHIDCRMIIWKDQGYEVLQENVCVPSLVR